MRNETLCGEIKDLARHSGKYLRDEKTLKGFAFRLSRTARDEDLYRHWLPSAEQRTAADKDHTYVQRVHPFPDYGILIKGVYWGPESTTPIHGHAPEGCVFRVIRGILQEGRPTAEADEEFREGLLFPERNGMFWRHRVANDVAYVQEKHQMKNRTSPAATVHVYPFGYDVREYLADSNK